MPFYKGTKVEKLDRECRRNAALYDVSQKVIQDVVKLWGLREKRERNSCCRSGHSFTPPLCQTEEVFSFFR